MRPNNGYMREKKQAERLDVERARERGSDPKYDSDSDSSEAGGLISVSDTSSAADSSWDDEGESNEEDSCEDGSALVNTGGKSGANTALDSGATEHCARHVPGTLESASVGSMSGLNGARTKVKGMGRVNQVKNVMHMPEISRYLLSVGRLLDQHGGKISFARTKADLITKDKSVKVAERDRSGLYIVCNASYELGSTHGHALAGTAVSLEVAKQRVIALHKAYGHALMGTLAKIIKNRNFEDGVSVQHLKLLPPCEACMLGKAHKAPKQRRAREKATLFGERLCADCSGPFRTQSVGGRTHVATRGGVRIFCLDMSVPCVQPEASCDTPNHLAGSRPASAGRPFSEILQIRWWDGICEQESGRTTGQAWDRARNHLR